MTTVLVTGGAGYVGSHAVLALMQAGYTPLVLDNLDRGHLSTLQRLDAEYVVGDVGDGAILDDIFSKRRIDYVMHFSAYAYVGESVTNPSIYYGNNVSGTISLLAAMIRHGSRNIIFSSTCATYGIPDRFPIVESMPQRPINPYGQGKLFVEKILQDYDAAYGLRSVIFRYFNAAGAHPSGCIGERHDPETHLIPLMLQACGNSSCPLRILGNDYSTRDGSCIRDYIHVVDIADAHVRGLQYLQAGGKSEVFNLGSGKGTSVFEIVEAGRRITGLSVATEIAPRRPGDPPALYAAADKAKGVLGWSPEHSDIDTIIRDAWNFYCINAQLAKDCS